MVRTAIGWETGLALVAVLAMSSTSESGQIFTRLTKLHPQIFAAAPAAAYPRRPFVLKDQVPPSSSFAQFRQRLLQAIRDRDARFIQSIADPQIKITFGKPIPFSQLGFNNPQSLVWPRLERIITIGCSPYEAPAGQQINAWQCPHVSQAALGDPFSDIYIVGTDVNVRALPQSNGAIVDVLSNEVVKANPAGFERMSKQQREESQTFAGWQPIITPKGIHGYVSSRYAYFPAGYRARFENKNGHWKMTVFITGD
uniref:SH3b domain-containing protein n=1 Tax=Cyanothece sp. (strain PCC 7425 / ATCC 29141) TaxID=395961 RepID=B8HTJ1_CYAP4